MILSQANLSLLTKNDGLIIPQSNLFQLPVKVLQFGTGVLLRGLPDYFIDKANRQGVFNGRVAVVKSTPGATTEFDEQDSLYTLCIRGLENGQSVSENIISSAISNVIAADQNWNEILNIAQSEDLKIVVSNTTEVGIALVEESIHQNPPASFPAKLLAVLHHRYQAFKGTATAGLVIIATELIPDNGKKLAAIVTELANFNQLDAEFLTWLATANTFCNSLVDRIVPGKPDATTLANLQTELGYTDNLLAMAEPYRLWAIEGNDKVKEALTFAQVDAGVVIAEDIEIYRELKVRLLNGTHTLTSGIAFLAGIDTVKNAMTQDFVRNYVEALMETEISPSIPYEVTTAQTTAFSKAVVDRFANPFIEHLWLNITFQYSMKMKIRILPLLLNHYKKYQKTPELIALGFAAYLLFMRTEQQQDGKYMGNYNGLTYPITDDSAAYFFAQSSKADYVNNVLSDTEFWGTDLSALPGFIEAVTEKYTALNQQGVVAAVAEITTSKINIA